MTVTVSDAFVHNTVMSHLRVLPLPSHLEVLVKGRRVALEVLGISVGELRF